MSTPTVPTTPPNPSDDDRVAPTVCRMGTSAIEAIGAPCRACGHTNIAHPGSHNPSLDACAICTVLAAAEGAR